MSKYFDFVEERKDKKIYIPKMNHPWKQKSYEVFVSKQAHRMEKEAS